MRRALSTQHKIIVGVIFLILFFNIVSSVLLVFRANYKLNQYAASHSRAIALEVDELFENILTDYYIKLDGHRTTCQEFLPKAQQFALKNPHIRSVSLTNNNFIYCSTISQDKKVPYTLDRTVQRVSIQYVNASPLVKNSDVFLLGLKTWDGSVKFGIDSLTIQNLLYTEMNYYTPTFVLDDYVVSRSKIEKVKLLQADGHYISNNQYLKVYYNISSDNYMNYFLINYVYYVVFFLILSFIIGVMLYSYLIRIDWNVVMIKGGLKRDEFVPFLQPIFNHLGQLAGAEVLVRWEHRKKGLIAPNEFIASAEQSGQIISIFSRMINKLVPTLTLHQHRLPDDFHIAFNVCAPQLVDAHLEHDCKMLQNSLTQCQLVIELTERVQIPDEQRFIDEISALKQQGIKIALDDFGIGHSSLSYLKNIKFDVLKIDKSFIDMINEHGSNDHIVANVLDLAERLDVPTVAEGIECEVQAHYLKAHGVNYFQGFYFGRPVPLHQFISQYCR